MKMIKTIEVFHIHIHIFYGLQFVSSSSRFSLVFKTICVARFLFRFHSLFFRSCCCGGEHSSMPHLHLNVVNVTTQHSIVSNEWQNLALIIAQPHTSLTRLSNLHEETFQFGALFCFRLFVDIGDTNSLSLEIQFVDISNRCASMNGKDENKTKRIDLKSDFVFMMRVDGHEFFPLCASAPV